jgi:hypothetical protein
MALLKEQEALCLELGDKASLQRSYGNQSAALTVPPISKQRPVQLR